MGAGKAIASNEAASSCPVYVCAEGASRLVGPESQDASEDADEQADDGPERCARILCSRWPA
jgi:hypothetical protein